MSPSATSFVVYVTEQLSTEDQEELFVNLNRPGRSDGLQPFEPYGGRKSATESALADKSVYDVVGLHKEWVQSNGIDRDTSLNGQLLVIADSGVARSSFPHSVLIVNTTKPYSDGGSEAFESLRILTANAYLVISAILRNEHPWSEFWNVAKVNGGHYPGE